MHWVQALTSIILIKYYLVHTLRPSQSLDTIFQKLIFFGHKYPKSFQTCFWYSKNFKFKYVHVWSDAIYCLIIVLKNAESIYAWNMHQAAPGSTIQWICNNPNSWISFLKSIQLYIMHLTPRPTPSCSTNFYTDEENNQSQVQKSQDHHYSSFQESGGPDNEAVLEGKEKVERFSFCTNEVFLCHFIHVQFLPWVSKYQKKTFVQFWKTWFGNDWLYEIRSWISCTSAIVCRALRRQILNRQTEQLLRAASCSAARWSLISNLKRNISNCLERRSGVNLSFM